MSFDKKILTQYQSAKSHGGLIDLSKRGKIEVTGKDRISFLHRMLTNDIQTLRLGEGCYACLLNPQAKIITDMNVHLFDNYVFLTTEPGFAEKTMQVLSKFIITDDVTFANKTSAFAALGLFGQNAEFLVRSLAKNKSVPTNLFSHVRIDIDTMECTLICLPLLGMKGWQFVTPMRNKEAFQNAILTAGKSCQICEMDSDTVEILRIESGTPLCGVDFTEETLLLETGLETRAVSFTKGCYPGQEIVARMDSRGKFAKKLAQIIVNVGVGFPDPKTSGEETSPLPQPGNLITKDGKEIGKITSACFSPKFSKPLALGYVARDFLAPGTEVEIFSAGLSAPAEIL